MDEATHLPWRTGPSGQGGSTTCGWCHREIYAPALPCSVEPVEGLLRMETQPGVGARCQYELGTRRPDVLRSARDEQGLPEST
jgi:hypothetical protein